MNHLYDKLSLNVEESLKQKVALHLKNELLNRRLKLEETQWSVITKKVIIYLIRSNQPQFEHWSELADAIQHYFESILHKNLGINTALELYHKHKQELAYKHRRELSKNLELTPELLVHNDLYMLCRLYTKRHLKDEGRRMDHCIAKKENDYMEHIIDGSLEIWSFRTSKGLPLLTIEYDLDNKTIVQAKKRGDKKLNGFEDWYKDVFMLLGMLHQKGVELGDIPVELPFNSILTSKYEVLDETDILHYSGEITALRGEMMLQNDMSDEVILKICSIPNLHIDSNSLNATKKSLIVEVKGTVKDYSNIHFVNLKKVSGNLNLSGATFRRLDKLEEVGGSADFSDSNIESVPKLKYVGQNLKLERTNMHDLNSLEEVGGNLRLANSKINSLAQLRKIGANLEILYSFDSNNLMNLQYLGGSLYIRYSKLESLGELEIITGNVVFDHADLNSLSKLRKISGNAHLSFCNVATKSMDNIEEIGGDVHFYQSNIQTLNKLKRIGGTAYFQGSSVKNLGKLEIVEGNILSGNLIKDWSQVRCLGKLY